MDLENRAQTSGSFNFVFCSTYKYSNSNINLNGPPCILSSAKMQNKLMYEYVEPYFQEEMETERGT